MIKPMMGGSAAGLGKNRSRQINKAAEQSSGSLG
jgi:hypothetical protein